MSKPRMVEDAPRTNNFEDKSDAWIRRELLCWQAIKKLCACTVCGAGLGKDCVIYPSNPDSWHNFYDIHFLRWQKYEHLSDLEKEMLAATYEQD